MRKRNKTVPILIDYLTWLLRHVLVRRLRQKSSIIIIIMIIIFLLAFICCCHFDLQNFSSLLYFHLIPFSFYCSNTQTLCLYDLSGLYLMLTISNITREKKESKENRRMRTLIFVVNFFFICLKRKKTLCLLINKWNLSVSWTTTHIHYEFEEGAPVALGNTYAHKTINFKFLFEMTKKKLKKERRKKEEEENN
jgi:phage-related holin